MTGVCQRENSYPIKYPHISQIPVWIVVLTYLQYYCISSLKKIIIKKNVGFHSMVPKFAVEGLE